MLRVPAMLTSPPAQRPLLQASSSPHRPVSLGLVLLYSSNASPFIVGVPHVCTLDLLSLTSLPVGSRPFPQFQLSLSFHMEPLTSTFHLIPTSKREVTGHLHVTVHHLTLSAFEREVVISPPPKSLLSTLVTSVSLSKHLTSVAPCCLNHGQTP